MTDARAPHKAILHITLEVHEVLKSGECSGNTVSDKDLQEYNIRPKFLLSVDGIDKFKCLEKLKNKLEHIND